MIDYNSPAEIVKFYSTKNHFDFSYQELDYIQVHSNQVEVNFSHFWNNKGHRFGEGLISPDKRFFCLKIPKNASSFLVKNLIEEGWSHSNIRDYPTADLLIILRDPVQRWTSGMVEYLFLYHESVLGHLSNSFDYEYYPLLGEQLGLSLLFERMTFDDHTERQCAFLQNVDLSKAHWFYFNDDLKDNLSGFLTSQGIDTKLNQAEKTNHTNSDNQVSLLKRKLKEFMTFALRDPFKKYNVEQWMWCDTKLIQSVKFYQINDR
jgi:hypothetical protein